MTQEQILEIYEKHYDLVGRFDKISVTNAFSSRRDFTIFCLIDFLLGPNDKECLKEIIGNFLYFNISSNDIPNSPDGVQIVKDLICCGVDYDEDRDCFYV